MRLSQGENPDPLFFLPSKNIFFTFISQTQTQFSFPNFHFLKVIMGGDICA